MRIALVRDWLTGFRGGEKVLLHLARRYPDADLYTLIHERGSVPKEIEDRRIVTSALDRLPGRARHYRKLLPLFPPAIRSFDLQGYDLVLSTSHAVAKSVRVPKGTPHIDYCFTPMRYVWDEADAYLGRGARRKIASPMVNALRRFDVRTSGPESVTRFVAISSEVARRIHKHYGRKAQVVAPPVDLDWIEPAQMKPTHHAPYLLVTGFVPYKQDLVAIEAFRDLDRELIVVGDGPGRARLTRSAPKGVHFVGRVSDSTLAHYYRSARALLYPQREDFGLVAVEAQAAGTPVIAYGAGGILDTVRPVAPLAESDATELAQGLPHFAPEAGGSIPEATGLFFEHQTPASLRDAILRFEACEDVFDPKRISDWAQRFTPTRFDGALDHEIEQAMLSVSR